MAAALKTLFLPTFVVWLNTPPVGVVAESAASLMPMPIVQTDTIDQ
jgi:hypothetical protein